MTQTESAGHAVEQCHGRRQHRYVAAGTALALGGALGYVGLVDPHNPHSVYPQCPFKWLTGWNCPFCGGLRMTHDLLHGHLAAAVNDNLFLLIGIPLLAGWLLIRRGRGKPAPSTPAWLAMTLAVIAWTVVRNLPGFPLFPAIQSG
ncbi:DUF2752 domain-containing protein [Mycobacterium europaeum]|uniref:DUF2752 domain-containing protein n=1 Tax=Mycobacterium europaeum TaxID=761804 RepID=UPI000A15F90C|nr:DUF2752 domain-containing protein [Mycobacterium europaeum]MEA1162108.1 DUF2752 domain-containing protein [Mycobacterium europaeum]ORV65215.1 hypothetical protein AWC03_02305 [Mycobacterium europaeum]